MDSISDIDGDTQRAIRAFAARLAGLYNVADLILFGCRARQSDRPDSDADVAVILHGHRDSFLETKLALADIAYEVFLDTHVLIQPMPIWENEWKHPESYANPRLLQNISREGIYL